jgi:hypothetical protein
MTESRIVGVLPLPLSINELGKKVNQLVAVFGKGLLSRQSGQNLLVFTPADFYPHECGCQHCDEKTRREVLTITGDQLGYISRFMILCPECGNKRCPRANHHDYACTGSNATEQPGSAYSDIPYSGERTEGEQQ